MGRGRGFAVHKALDQVGAFAGPLLVAGVLAVTGVYWPGFLLLAVPGAVSMLLLAQLRRRVPSVAEPDPEDTTTPAPVGWRTWHGVRTAVLGSDLPRAFHLFAASAALTTAGLMTFGVISYRFVDTGLVTIAAAPLVYALAMGAEALAALATGDLFDRWGPHVLLCVPVLVAVVPVAASPTSCGSCSSASSSGAPRPASRTRPSRRTSRAWSPRAGARRRTASSPRCRAWVPWREVRWRARW